MDTYFYKFDKYAYKFEENGKEKHQYKANEFAKKVRYEMMTRARVAKRSRSVDEEDEEEVRREARQKVGDEFFSVSNELEDIVIPQKNYENVSQNITDFIELIETQGRRRLLKMPQECNKLKTEAAGKNIPDIVEIYLTELANVIKNVPTLYDYIITTSRRSVRIFINTLRTTINNMRPVRSDQSICKEFFLCYSDTYGGEETDDNTTLFIMDSINIIRDIYLLTDDARQEYEDSSGQATRARFDYNMDGCDDTNSPSTGNARLFIDDTLHDFYASKGLWPGLPAYKKYFDTSVQSSVRMKPSTNIILNKNLRDRTQSTFITFIKTSYKQTLCAPVGRQSIQSDQSAAQTIKRCTFNKNEDTHIRALFQNYQRFSFDCGSTNFFQDTRWNKKSADWIIPIMKENVLAKRFDPSGSEQPSKTNKKKQLHFTSFDDIKNYIAKNRYTIITNQNPLTNDILQMIELCADKKGNIAINFINSLSVIIRDAINLSTLENVIDIIAPPGGGVSILYRGDKTSTPKMTYNTYYVNGQVVKDSGGENIPLSRRGGWTINDITEWITNQVQPDRSGRAAGGTPSWIARTPPHPNSQALDIILQNIVPDTTRNAIQKRFLCALEFKRIGDWGQIENIKYVNEISKDSPTAKPTLFVTCDKIAAHIAMCHNVPTFVTFDKSDDTPTSIVGKIVKAVKTVTGSKFKTYCFFTPPLSPMARLQRYKSLYDLQLLAYKTSLNDVWDTCQPSEDPDLIKDHRGLPLVLNTLRTGIMRALIKKYCELYVCNNKWIEVIKDIPLSFDIEKLQNPYDDNNNMITAYRCSNIDEGYRGRDPRWQWPPNRKNEKEAAAGLFRVLTNRVIPSSDFKLFYIFLMMIFKIFVTRNVFMIGCLTKLKNMIENVGVITTPFLEAVRNGETIFRHGRSVTTLKNKIKETVVEFKNFLTASNKFSEVSEADPTTSILEIFPDKDVQKIRDLKLNELYKKIVVGVQPNITELATIGDNVGTFFKKIVDRATARS